MNTKTRESIKGWLATYNGDIEACARWMRDSLRIGGLKDCRALINEALA